MLPKISALNKVPNPISLIRQKQSNDTQSLKDTIKILSESIAVLSQRISENNRNNGDQKMKEIRKGERMEERFRDFDAEIYKIQEKGEQRNQKILIWLSNVCKQIFSIGFKLYESGQLDLNKVKAYCSQNFLRNLLSFSKINQLSSSDLQMINKFMEADLLPYFCQKYPESEETETSSKFSSDLIQRDTMENNQYDLIKRSQVRFDYKQSGNYNAEIMRFLNYVIKLPNQVVEDKEKAKPLNQLFLIEMRNLFTKIQVESYTINMQKFNTKKPDMQIQWTVDTSTEKQKQEYQQKVKSYTSFQIGQKLSKNFQPFSEFEIQSGDLKLKNSQIMRVLTKWCQQLQNVFKKSTILKRQVPFKMKDKSENLLQVQETKHLAFLFERQKKNIIQKFKQQIKKNNNQHQSQLLKRPPTSQLLKFSQSESPVGEFSSLIFKNNATYLILYLNTLIHGINTVGHYYARRKQSTVALDDGIPDLISFKIGDLMRCKCSSKEAQIIALYKEVQRMHRDPNSGIKIIRVKNRLNRGNKDILMNLQYKGKIVVEMQLAIKAQKSKFIQCSYNFNHYLYELKRAQFGPIMEMCNIWINKDLKSKFYLEKIQKINIRQKQRKPLTNLEQCCLKNSIQLSLPFRCSQCLCFYNTILPDSIKCKKCQSEICYLCQLQNSQHVRSRFFSHFPKAQYPTVKTQNINFCTSVPQKGGFIINLGRSGSKAKMFLSYQQQDGEIYMLEWNPIISEIKVIMKLNMAKFSHGFLKENIIISSTQIQKLGEQFLADAQKQINNYFIRKYLKQAKKNEKNSIYLVNRNITQQAIVVSKEEQKQNDNVWPNAKELNLSENEKLDKFQQLGQKFPNLQFLALNSTNMKEIPKNQWHVLKKLHLASNPFSNPEPFSSLSEYKNLEELVLRQCKLEKFPQEILQLEKLELLGIQRNQLSQLPEGIQKLKFLKKLELQRNALEELPHSICKLVQLIDLSLYRNRLKAIPEEIGKLKKLRFLQMRQNQIQVIPQSIGQLSLLEDLSLRQNKIKILPDVIEGLKSILKLSLSYNNISSLPKSIGNLKTIKHLNLDYNLISELPNQFSNLKSLQELKLGGNKFQKFPNQIFELRSLKSLFYYNNKLEELPKQISQLQYLQYLDLQKNALRSLPFELCVLINLRNLILSGNKLKQLPQKIGNLQSLQCLYIENNRLKDLPPSLYTLLQLQTLFMQSNKFEQISPNLVNLKSLQSLLLQGNKLSFLPSELANCPSLKVLQFGIYTDQWHFEEIDEIFEALRKRGLAVRVSYLDEYSEIAEEIRRIGSKYGINVILKLS